MHLAFSHYCCTCMCVCVCVCVWIQFESQVGSARPGSGGSARLGSARLGSARPLIQICSVIRSINLYALIVATVIKQSLVTRGRAEQGRAGQGRAGQGSGGNRAPEGGRRACSSSSSSSAYVLALAARNDCGRIGGKGKVESTIFFSPYFHELCVYTHVQRTAVSFVWGSGAISFHCSHQGDWG